MADIKHTSLIRLAIVDDHQIVIDGLKLLLQDKKKFLVAVSTTSAKDMIAFLKQDAVDLLITDIMMPVMDGYELSVKVRQEIPGLKILALSMSEDGFMISKMIEQAKVDGYIPKASGKQELLSAIETIVSGNSFFSPEILAQYESYKKVKSESELFNLTARELQVIECVIEHLSNKEIASKLFISERTVETHRKNIFRKTNTKGIPTLVAFVKAHNLLR